MFSEIQSDFKEKLDLDQVSFMHLKNPMTIQFYKDWLAEDYFGSMNYLKDHLQFKEDPQRINPEFRSVITITQSYFPFKKPISVPAPARIALYAQNDDYHFWLKDKLNAAIEILKQKFPTEIFTPYVDSGPILEKDFAYQAGHGWFGKNSCLIHPQKGSLFFVAEILTSLHIEDSINLSPLPDMCGTCTRCIEICPTQAIVKPKTIQADRCISYLTIEAKEVPALELRPKMHDWFFGCDLCQTVCPWNEKVFRTQKIPASNNTSTHNFLDLTLEEQAQLHDFLKMILQSSNKHLQKHFYGTALHRAAGFGLKKNALIVIANRKIKGLEKEIETVMKDEKLAELAKWALSQLTS